MQANRLIARGLSASLLQSNHASASTLLVRAAGASALSVETHRTMHVTSPTQKSKRSQVSTKVPDIVEEVPVIKTRGKGSKGASSSPKGARSKRQAPGEEDDAGETKTTTTDTSLPDERFNEAGLKANMERAVKRCRDTVAQMVGSHGRADPSLLDNIKVTFTGTNEEKTSGESTSGSKVKGDGEQYSLRDFATVGVRDGALIVTCFDAESVKQVERAIYAAQSQLGGLAPQQTNEEGVLRIPVPKPTAETRAQLVKDVNRICENARVSIRSARHAAQKQIKDDTKRKVVGTNEAQQEMKKMEDETKKRSAEVEELYEQTKKRIEQGQ